MALLPDSVRLRVAPDGPKVWPIVQCENVFILPGVPQFFEQKMDTIVAHFLGKRSLFTRKIVLGVDGACFGFFRVSLSLWTGWGILTWNAPSDLTSTTMGGQSSRSSRR